MKVVQVFKGYPYFIYGINFSPDGQWLTSFGGDRVVRIQNMTSSQKSIQIENRDGPAVFSPDSKFFTTVNEKQIEVRRIEDLEVVLEIKGFKGGQLMFSPDGKLLVNLSPNDISVWSTSDGALIYSIHKQARLAAVSFANNKLIAAGWDGDLVKLWDIETGKEIRTLGKHSERILNAAFSPDGRLLATGTGSLMYVDNTVIIWDVETGQMLKKFANKEEVWALAFSPDGRFLAVLTKMGTVDLWGVDPRSEKVIAAATQVASQGPRRRFYGPVSGVIDSKRWQQSTNWISTGVSRRDYVIDVTLTISSTENQEWPWPFHIAFRQFGQYYGCRLDFSITGKWSFGIDSAKGWRTVDEGKIPGYKLAKPFHVKLIVKDRFALFYLDDTLVSIFDISDDLESGNVVLALPLGVEYQNFTVSEIPDPVR